MEPPIANIIAHETEIHGEKLIDNYFWIRGKEKQEVIDYLEAENAYTDYKMKHTEKLQEKLYHEMKGRIKETDETYPAKRGDYFYYSRTEEGKQYNIFCRKRQDSVEEIILDLNMLAEGKEFLSLRAAKVSPDHTMIAYTTDITGYEKFNLSVKDIETGEIIHIIEDVSGSFLWGDDNRIFYITDDEIHRPYRVHRYNLTDRENKLLFEELDTIRSVEIHKGLDNRYLIIHSDSITSSEAHFLDLKDENAQLKLFLAKEDKHEYSLDYHEDYFYILSNEDAVNFKLMRTPITNYEKSHWELVIPHDENVKLNWISAFKNYIIVHKRDRGLKKIGIRDLNNKINSHDIKMPEEIYSVFEGQNLEYEMNTYRISYSSFTTPETTYDYDIATRKLILRKQKEIKGHNADKYETKREFAKASDGKMVPISIVYKKGISNAPTLLGGYGSYGYTNDPAFSPNILSLLERGMIYAYAHIRGSSFLGKQWYEDGKFLNKKNTFTDFIAAGEHLIEKGYTTKEKLAITGGSAGGLLMGACVNMRPDLFKVVIALVPFVDVINTMLDESIPLTAGEWQEWGDPRNPEYFKYMRSYSPYDNVEKKDYPIMLVTAGLNDPRVHYWEPAKWVAKLRSMKTDSNLLLLKTNMGAGHSGASGRYDYLKEVAFRWAFLLDNLNVDY